MHVKIQKWGNSHGIRIPKYILDSLGAKAGDSFEIEVSLADRVVILSPVKQNRGRYKLEELIQKMPDSSIEEYDWGKPAGREVV